MENSPPSSGRPLPPSGHARRLAPRSVGKGALPRSPAHAGRGRGKLGVALGPRAARPELVLAAAAGRGAAAGPAAAGAGLLRGPGGLPGSHRRGSRRGALSPQTHRLARLETKFPCGKERPQRKARQLPRTKHRGARGFFGFSTKAAQCSLRKQMTCLVQPRTDGQRGDPGVVRYGGLEAVLRLEVPEQRALPLPLPQPRPPALPPPWGRAACQALGPLVWHCFSRQGGATADKRLPKRCRTESCPSPSVEFDVRGKRYK